MNLKTTLPLLIVLACTLGACKESSLYPTPIDSKQTNPDTILLSELQGATWNLVAFHDVNGTPGFESTDNWVTTSIPTDQVFTITFNQNEVSGRADCNEYVGVYHNGRRNGMDPPVEQTQLMIELLSGTYADCGDNSFDKQYLEALENATSYRATSTDLYIYYNQENSVLQFSRIADDIRLEISPTSLPPSGAPYELTSFSVADDIIRFNVAYTGCQQDAREFVLYGPVEISPASPVTKATLYLIHRDLDAASCALYFQEIQEFNLTPLKENYQQQSGQQSGSIELTIIGPSSIVPTDNTIVYNF